MRFYMFGLWKQRKRQFRERAGMKKVVMSGGGWGSYLVMTSFLVTHHCTYPVSPCPLRAPLRFQRRRGLYMLLHHQVLYLPGLDSALCVSGKINHFRI